MYRPLTVHIAALQRRVPKCLIGAPRGNLPLAPRHIEQKLHRLRPVKGTLMLESPSEPRTTPRGPDATIRAGSRQPTWPWILVGFAVVICLLAAAAVALIAQAKDNFATSAGADQITYEVSFDHPVQGGVLTTNIAVAYTDSDGRIVQTVARTVPWRTTVDLTDSTRYPAITATNDDTDQTIVCTVRSGETVLATHIATGPHASAYCS